MTNRIRFDESGFTLVELMIVLVVLGILAGIVLFGVGSFQGQAEDARTSENARTCHIASAAAEAYNATHVDVKTANDFVEDGTGC